MFYLHVWLQSSHESSRPCTPKDSARDVGFAIAGFIGRLCRPSSWPNSSDEGSTTKSMLLPSSDRNADVKKLECWTMKTHPSRAGQMPKELPEGAIYGFGTQTNNDSQNYPAPSNSHQRYRNPASIYAFRHARFKQQWRDLLRFY